MPMNLTRSAAAEDGHDLDDWLRAGAEITGTAVKAGPRNLAFSVGPDPRNFAAFLTTTP